jgi:hypothetical protein
LIFRAQTAVTLVRAGVSILATAGTSKIINDVITEQHERRDDHGRGSRLGGQGRDRHDRDGLSSLRRSTRRWEGGAKMLNGKQVKVTVEPAEPPA